MDPREMDGLTQLRSTLARGDAPGIARTMNFALIDVAEGHAVFEGTPGREVYNPIGTVHGGYAATLLDSALGCAVHSRLAPGQGYTTLELKVAYHRALTEGVTVRATGKVLTMGRRVAFAEATLTDAEARLYASATSTLLVMTPEAKAA